MTPDTALRLERLLGVEAQFWLNLQLVWDLYHARRSGQTETIRRIHRLPQLRRAS
jgi:plasmid maintenance system antidote protein VapI